MDIATVLLLNVAIRLILGVATAAIAKNKGRHAFGWFWGGFLLGLIGVIIVAVLPNLNKEKRVREQSEMERRRLREQLLQERMKNESFRQHVTHRLDAHDTELGMETRALGNGQTAGQLTEGAAENAEQDAVIQRLTAGGAQEADARFGETDWYYAAEGVTHGPFSHDEVTSRFRLGELGAQTLVWTTRLGNWTPARDVPELRGELPA